MPKYKVIKELKSNGWPTANKKYHEAHKIANKVEEKDYGKKAFKYMEKVDDKLKRGELAGKNTRTGKIEVSKKVPKAYRAEVAQHESTEYKALKRLTKGKKKVK